MHFSTCYVLTFFMYLNYSERSLLLSLLQDKGDFELATLPALVPVFTSASGETLLLLVKHADLIINKVIRVTY